MNKMKKIMVLLMGVVLPSLLLAQNTNISNGSVFDGEPYLAINPNNPQHMVVAWMGFKMSNQIVIKTTASFNGGQTWSVANFAPHTNPAYGSADPSLAFDAAGNVFLCYIDYDDLIDSGSVYIRKSIDGGLNWGAPTEVINAHSDAGKYPVDRPWISIDNSGGSYSGNIYITTMPPRVFGYLPPPYHPYFIRSVDGGNSFEPWMFLDNTGWLAGNYIPQPMPTNTVTSNGIFHAAYPSWVTSQHVYPQYILASSSDGGNTLNYKSIINLSGNVAFNDSLAKKGYLLRSNPNNPDHLIFILLLNNYGDGDVFFMESFNSGNTWSGLTRVNDDPIGNNRMQDLIWADFDLDGDLIVTWRDRRNAPDSTYTTSSEIWGAFRHKDSLNFAPNFLISDTQASYDTILASAGNDFMCVKFRHDTINSVWGDTRSGRLNIYFQRISFDGTTVSIQQISSEIIPYLKVSPNPSSDFINVEAKGIKNISLFDSFGKVIFQINNPITKDEMTLNIKEFPSGNYILRVLSENGIQTRKIIKN
jgi:hypothetical protein